jgi:lactoylglutathione lyase
MKYEGPMLVVKNIEKSKEFYTKILQIEVISDLGANVTFTGGLSLQTEESWAQFTGCKQNFFSYGGNDAELYFEEAKFEEFITRIENENIEFIGAVTIMPWGQKIIRFYDPDQHIIEVGEDFAVVIKRLYKTGLSIDEIVAKTYTEKETVEQMLATEM